MQADPSVLRPCIGIGGEPCGRPTPGPRCPGCARVHERRRPPRPTTLTRDWAEQQRRKAAVDAHIQRIGYVCPGWRRDSHSVLPPNILTADHVRAVAGGGGARGGLQVLCRVCNGAKSDRDDE